jgi:hypothetical protein
MINIRRTFLSLLLTLPLTLPAAPEGFEKLLPMGTIETARPQMKANNWKYSEPVLTPCGWHLTPYQKDGEYRIVTDKSEVYKGENSIFIKGDIATDITLLQRQNNDNQLKVQLYARSNMEGGSITLQANLYTANGVYLGSKSVSVNVGPEWKQYNLQVEIPTTTQNQPVEKIGPSIGSTTGAFFDEVEFFSAKIEEKGGTENKITPSACDVIEGFENLSISGNYAAIKQQLIDNHWKYSDPIMTPQNWYLTPFSLYGEYTIITDPAQVANGKKSIYLKGYMMVDPTVFSIKPEKEYLEITLKAKSSTPKGTICAIAHLQDMDGVFIGSTSELQTDISDQWKEYTTRVPIPAEANGKKVGRVAPAIGSINGAFFDDVKISAIDGKAPAALPKFDRVDKVSPEKLLMHFNFDAANGKKEILDKNQKWICYSDENVFSTESGGLRVAYGSRFRIPMPDDAVGDGFTISAWILKSGISKLNRTPILSRGYTQAYGGPAPTIDEFDFGFGLNAFLPEFATFNGGLTTEGVPYNAVYRYSDIKWRKHVMDEPVSMDQWQYIAAVYDRGSIDVYANGKLVATMSSSPSKGKLLSSNQDLYIGATRVKGENDNKVSAEMLINDLKIYTKALNAAEIAGDYLATFKNYPNLPVRLETSKAYYSKEMLEIDPNMTRRLPLTSKYNANLPSDLYPKNHHMTGKFDNKNWQTRLFIDDNPIAMVSANPIPFDPVLWTTEEFVRDFAAAGVTIDQIGPGMANFWIGQGKYDWSIIDNRIRASIRANPRAKIMVGVFSTPPEWFMKEYPDELEEYYIDNNNLTAGKLKWRGPGGPMGSNKWVELSCQMLRDYIKHIESSDYANHVWGYAFAGGDAGEWYWPGQFSNGMSGYSKPTFENFKKFLRKRYNNDDKSLQKAWNELNITFDTVKMPTPNERSASENGFFRDPVTQRKFFDLRDFLNAQTMFNFTESARAIRETAGNNKVILTYYGYPLLYAGRGNVMQVSGMQTTREVLMSPYIDAIATPIDYLRRRGGEPGVNIAGFTGSALLHGKAICREEDIRTHFWQSLEYGRTATLAETTDVIKRGFGYSMAENYMMWFVCQAGNYAYHQNNLMSDIKKFQDAAQKSVTMDRRDISEIALIFDEKSSMNALGVTNNDFITRHIWSTYEAAHEMGAPFKLYFIEDIIDKDVPDYKMYVFLNAYDVAPELRVKIKQKIRKNNAVSVWCYAPGYVSKDGFSLKGMEDLTSFKMIESKNNGQISPNVINKNHNITKYAKVNKPFICDPVFSVKDSNAKILSKAGDINSIAVKEFENYRSVYSLEPLTRELLLGLAAYAGVHLYIKTNDTLLANKSYIMITSANAGEKIISLPKRSKVLNAITERVIAEDTKKFSITMPSGFTEIFHIISLE